jgi:hypothetical protein
MTHYKSLISILSICKNVTSSHVMSSFSIKKYFGKLKEHVISFFTIEKIIQKIHFMTHHLFPLKKNYKNLSSMPHHFNSCHLSLLKNNYKNSRKSSHVISPFSIEFFFLKIQENHLMSHHLSLLIFFSKNPL